MKDKNHKTNVVGQSSGSMLVMEQNLITDAGKLQSDVEQVFKDQKNIITRPNVAYSLALTVLATSAMAYYHGTDEVAKLGLKAVYAALSQIVGINVGLAVGSEHVDNIAFAGGYYLLTSMSGNLQRFNQKNGLEAVVGAVAGYAANYYFHSQNKN